MSAKNHHIPVTNLVETDLPRDSMKYVSLIHFLDGGDVSYLLGQYV